MELRLQALGLAELARLGQQFQPLGRGQAAHVTGLEQAPIQQALAQGTQPRWTFFAPAQQVVARAQVIVGEEVVIAQLVGLPQPAGHHPIGVHLGGSKPAGGGDRLA